MIKAVFNLGIKLVICGRDDFTCKEPLLLTLRAPINEEYRDTCKGMCKVLLNPNFPHSISLHQHLLLILIRADAVNFCLYLRTPRYYGLDNRQKYCAHRNGEKLSQRLLTVTTSDSNTWSYLNPRKTFTCRGLYQNQNPLIKETIALSPYLL